MAVDFRERLRAFVATLRIWRTTLVHEHGGPVRIGAAVAFGVLLGCSPFYGIQTLVGLGLAPVLRLNRLAVLLGLQVSIPPIAPFLLFANAQLGAMVLRGVWLPVSVSGLRAAPISSLLGKLFLDLLIGGAIVGAALGAFLGLLTTCFVHVRRRDEQVI